MAIRIKSPGDMVREIIASLKAGDRGHPVFSLLLGSGFSVPIIPTPSQMLKGDIAWWCYWKEQKLGPRFCDRADGISQTIASHEQVGEFEREMWKTIHSKAAVSGDTAFPLGADGLPDLSDPQNVGLAYQAVMAEGLINNRMRRQYLRDAIARTYPRVNAAHIFLAGILEAQETWGWSAPFCRTIFTTNFDPLLQRSLQLVNKLYYMSDRPDVLEPPDDAESDAIHLVYTHGSVHRYDLRNTGDQIRQARERNAPALLQHFQRHGIIVIGYSGWEDTTMEALLRCPSFDSNLYWCDIHPVASAGQRLRPEVLKVLEAGEKNAFYVPITDAGEAMRLLHRELKLGDVPKFILDPVATMITQLESIEVPTEPAAPAKPEATEATHASDHSLATLQAAPLPTTLTDLRDGTLKRLRIAKSAFDNPAIVQPETQQGQQDVATAIAAKLLSDAFVAYSWGKRENAIDLLSAVIDTPQISGSDRAIARYNRGVIFGEIGETAKAIADYTAVIEMADAPAEQKAMALYNRGVRWSERGETLNEIADYTALIDMTDAPAEQKAKALYNRGVRWGESGETAKEIADYTAVIDITDTPAEEKARALFNRGGRWGDRGETARAIADYTTVIDMTDAPAEAKAKALNNRSVSWAESGETAKAIADVTSVIKMGAAPAAQMAWAVHNRGVIWGRSGETAKAIADFTAVIEMADAPPVQKAMALNNRGVIWGGSGETTKVIADCTAVIEMVDAPVDQKAKALYNRGVKWGESGEPAKAIADYTAVIGMADAPAEEKAKALNNRGVSWGESGETAKAITDYTAVIEMVDAPVDQKAIAFLNRGWRRYADQGDVRSMIKDSRDALALAADKHLARANLALGFLLTGEVEAAQAEYDTLLSMTSDAAVIRAAIDDLEAALKNGGRSRRQRRSPIGCVTA